MTSHNCMDPSRAYQEEYIQGGQVFVGTRADCAG